MSLTTPERYAVVSCHVERPLDDRVWAAFSSLQERRPGGLAIAALMRPPDAEAGEAADEERWLDRARAAAQLGPLGHHTHWTSPTHARPTGGDPGARVLRESAWLQQRGIAPSLFCGGGWYTDEGVAAACAERGYVDCTPRSRRPAYLPDDAAWATLDTPARVALEHGLELPAVPTTHGLGELVRALVRPGALSAPVHAYFHDTDLLDDRRRRLIVGALAVLGLRRPAVDLPTLVGDDARVVAWADIARGRAVFGP
ncbi:MAG: hypothetical protein ACR2HI_12115 [Gaiella sp.]